MKSYGLNELRKMYLDFFESKDHLKMDSFPLVPQNDKSLLLINAGMAPLKPYFTGQEIPPRNRVTTCQKCIRTGDIENVGKTARHGTFFEMLGNFSFGDYFKEEAIIWAWEFFTEVLQIPKDLLYVSVYLEDDEAEKLWHEKAHVQMDHIVRMGKEDNFWEHGAGPCGPCSEIYFDRGDAFGCGSADCKVGCDCDRFVEIWNLVFTQFDKTDAGEYVLLPKPNIDTGMGLERLAVMMQGVDSIFDVDTVKAIRDAVCEASHVAYKADAKVDVSIRLITDHIRSVTFMTSDGILPSNEGRGYVLRRLLRRAARHGKLLGIEGKFLSKLAEVVIQTSKDAYQELFEKEAYILKIISVEEDRFDETIDQGLSILKGYIEDLKGANEKILSGASAFKLYDTYGFPLDLTLEILEENDLKVDEDAFKKEMNEQRQRARAAREETNYMGAKETVYNQLDTNLENEFVGYETLEHTSNVIALTTQEDVVTLVNEGQEVSVFVNETPFYALSGGQAADVGTIYTNSCEILIHDVQKVVGNKIAHIGTVTKGSLKLGETVSLKVDTRNRYAIAKNHSTTHLLQKALRNIIGNHVEQAGSNVNAERLRFDFTHFTALTSEELESVEKEVNEKISEGLKVNIQEMSIEDAKKAGAMALFGEKYGTTVRVVKMGDYSTELCGGTHLNNTSEVSTFKIISETGVAAGVRRIEALTSDGAISYYKGQEDIVRELAAKVKSEPTAIVQKVDNLLLELKKLQSENEKLKSKAARGAVDDLLSSVEKIKDVELLCASVVDIDMNGLRDMGDQFKQKLKNGVVVLASKANDQVNLIVMASDEAVKMGAHAGKMIGEIAKVVGGGGGGRPNIAQAGGKNPEKIEEALIKAKEILQTQL
ncbi:MAG: alanine--tRNA ligase [Firmicutes bacterium HGW-Firmicutes-1]|nr:MAG: alanine--tRNA ligase [Firmicutes bacterium HGW-Firmicutes-1]